MEEKMKRGVLIFLGCIIIGGMITGCNNKKNDTSRIRIGYTVNSLDKWTSYVVDEVRAWAASHPEVDVIIGDSQDDESKQMQQVEDWIAQKYDAICVKPVSIASTADMLAKAKAAKIPYIAVQQPVPGADGWVGADSYGTGLAEMDKVVQILGQRGSVAYISGDLQTVNAQDRERGALDSLKKYSSMTLAGNETSPHWERSVAITIVENWLQAGIRFDGIVCACDEIAIGARIALDNAGIQGRVIAGIDGTPDALQMIVDGKLDFTMYDDPSIISHKSLDLALDLINGKAIEDYPYALDIVDKSNVQEYLNK
jgi:ABC-type sugar transport system substrate-binding protein